MEVDDNVESWVPPINHQKIGRNVEKMFLYRDRRIKKAVARDGNEIGEIRKGIKIF